MATKTKKKRASSSSAKPKASCQVTGKTATGKTKRVCHAPNGKIISFDKAKAMGYSNKRRKAS